MPGSRNRVTVIRRPWPAVRRCKRGSVEGRRRFVERNATVVRPAYK